MCMGHVINLHPFKFLKEDTEIREIRVFFFFLPAFIMSYVYASVLCAVEHMLQIFKIICITFYFPSTMCVSQSKKISVYKENNAVGFGVI